MINIHQTWYVEGLNTLVDQHSMLYFIKFHSYGHKSWWCDTPIPTYLVRYHGLGRVLGRVVWHMMDSPHDQTGSNPISGAPNYVWSETSLVCFISWSFIHMTTFGDNLPLPPCLPCTAVRTGVGHSKQKAIASDHMDEISWNKAHQAALGT